MHEIYKDKGGYNLLYRMTDILYSSFISDIISSFLEYLALTENTIIEIKKVIKFWKKKKSTNITLISIEKKLTKTKRCMKIKIALFYIFEFLLLILFWFYISCFCVVYRNTQIHVIKDTFFSFGISLLYPIGSSLLPGIFRIYALRAKNQNQQCVYKMSQCFENVSLFICF